MNNTETKVICPKCGAEIAISEHEHITTGIAIGKDSNLGTIPLPLADNSRKKRMTAHEKLKKLEAAGVDTSSLFAMKGNDTNLFKLTDREFEVMEDNDPIFQQIMQEGVVPNRRLFRRWIMGQTFRRIAQNQTPDSYVLQRGSKWLWKVIVREFKTQMKLSHNDTELFCERNRFFNAETLLSVACDHLGMLRLIAGVKIKPSKAFPDKNSLIELIELSCETLAKDRSPEQVYFVAQKLERAFSHIHFTSNMRFKYANKYFVDAFIAAGSFYTMQNLILFHDCVFFTDSKTPMTKISSMIYLNQIEYSDLIKEMERLMRENNIDVEAKMAEWRKR